MIRKILIVIMALLMAFSAMGETVMHAVNVGKGDAIIISVGESHFLIDTAKGYACGRIDYAMRELGIDRLECVFITHVDSDHIEGLDWLLQSGIQVESWYASPCFFEYKEKKHPLMKRGLDVTWLSAGDIVEFDGGKFTVIGPIEENPDEENNNSLVMMLETADGRILLTGDAEFPEENAILESGADVACDILKVSNHGDEDATGGEFLEKAAPEIAVISTDSYEKPGTPAPEVLFGLEGVGAEVFVTENASAVKAVLDENGARAEYVTFVSYPYENLTMEIDRENEIFTLKNEGVDTIDLEGWYIYSEKGNELYIMPGYIMEPGDEYRVGTKSSPAGNYEFFWDEKNVIHNEKEDVISLYDCFGNLIATE